MLRFRLRWAKVSVALPKIAMWRQPSRAPGPGPRSLGTSTGRSLALAPRAAAISWLGVGELGHPPAGARSWWPRRPAGPRRASAADELGLDSTRDDALLVLQPVARADLVDGDTRRGKLGRGHRRSPARPRRGRRRASTCSPTVRRSTAVTSRANGARGGRAPSSSPPARRAAGPCSTRSPSATSTARQVPGIGAVQAALAGPDGRAAANASWTLEDGTAVLDHDLHRGGRSRSPRPARGARRRRARRCRCPRAAA